jgi:hypothetical protein
MRLLRRSVAKDGPEPKAISRYGLYLPGLDRRWLRFPDGRPVGGVKSRLLAWSRETLEALLGKKVPLLIWENAGWHTSKERSGAGSATATAVSGRAAKARGIVSCLLPKQSLWAERHRAEVGARQEKGDRARGSAGCLGAGPQGLPGFRSSA